MTKASEGAKSTLFKPGGAGVERRFSSSEAVWDVTEAADDVGRSDTEAVFRALERRSLRIVISSFASVGEVKSTQGFEK